MINLGFGWVIFGIKWFDVVFGDTDILGILWPFFSERLIYWMKKTHISTCVLPLLITHSVYMVLLDDEFTVVRRRSVKGIDSDVESGCRADSHKLKWNFNFQFISLSAIHIEKTKNFSLTEGERDSTRAVPKKKKRRRYRRRPANDTPEDHGRTLWAASSSFNFHRMFWHSGK